MCDRPIAHLLLLAALAAPQAVAPSVAADRGVIDRLLVAVNGRVVTERDIVLARNLAALMSLEAVTAPSGDRELERMIDLEIMRQELQTRAGFTVDPRRIDAVVRDLENAFSEIGGLPALLRRLGLEPTELREYVALQLAVEIFIDSRFRPFVTVEPDEIETYYRTRLVPRLRESRAVVPRLEAVREDVTRVLREEKVTAALERWLVDVRRHSRIERFTGPAFPGEARP